jgi:NhaA family Na+:H+ antiporter
MSNPTNPNRIVRWLSEFSIPLIAGVVCALLLSNIAPDFYHRIVHTPITDAWSSADAHDTHVDHHAAEEVHASHTNVLAIDSHSPQTNTSKADSDNVHHAEQEHGGWSHYATLHFLINDVFMVFFFGIAAKEITEACLPNGALNPISKAINPLFATVGGILGPVAVYLGLNAFCGQAEWANGWGIPTAERVILPFRSYSCLRWLMTQLDWESLRLPIPIHIIQHNGLTSFGLYPVSLPSLRFEKSE